MNTAPPNLATNLATLACPCSSLSNHKYTCLNRSNRGNSSTGRLEQPLGSDTTGRPASGWSAGSALMACAAARQSYSPSVIKMRS
jgi:hypothetical protein